LSPAKMLWRKSSPSTACHSTNYEEIFISLKFVLLRQHAKNPAGTTSPTSQTLHHLRERSVLCSSRCCRFPHMCRFFLMGWSVFLLFLWVKAVRGLTLRGWLAATVLVLKMLCPSSGKDSALSVVSKCMPKSCPVTRCGVSP
jgi:hypothetical protein